MHSMWIPNESKNAEASSCSFFIFEEDETWEWEGGKKMTPKIESEKWYFIAELSLGKIICQSLPISCRCSWWEDLIRKYMYLQRGEIQEFLC